MKLDELQRPPPNLLACPRCHTVLKGPREPGWYKCKPCGANFYLPEEKEEN